MGMWASEPDAVGARETHRRHGNDREDQWPSAFENRDGMAVDALVMTVFMATSCR